MSEPPRPVGRPPLKRGEASTTAKVRVTVSDYDRACRLALKADVSVSKVFRTALHRMLRDDPSGDDE